VSVAPVAAKTPTVNASSPSLAKRIIAHDYACLRQIANGNLWGAKSTKNLVTKLCHGATLRQVDHTYGDFRARREASVWRRLNRILLVLLIIAIWLVIVSLFVPPYKKLMQSRAEIDNLQQQVNEQQTLLARQTREVTLLKTDVTYLETIARDRLDLMKEGETIFRLETARAKPKPVDSARR
jgi:cell division protein FtsB